MSVELTEAQILRLKPGDMLVARCPHSMSGRDMNYVRAALQSGAPDGVRVVAIPVDVELEGFRVEVPRRDRVGR